MKARVEIRGESRENKDHRFLELRVLPRIGELLETDFCGTCRVVQITHTPQSKLQDVVVVLERTGNPEKPS